MRAFAVLGLASALLVACSGGPVSSATPTLGASVAPSSAASRTADLVVGGDRPVTVHVPPSYDPARPAPLLIVLHGYGSSGTDHDTYLRLGGEAERRGFLYAHPDGTKDSIGNRFWNATEACCDFDRSGVDDTAYLAGVITAIQSSLSLDPKRIFLVGHSNGAFMSYRMACVHADVVAAIVSLAGATFANPADCAPVSPVAVLQIHGTADDTIAFTGGTIEGLGSGQTTAPYPGAQTSTATWAKYDGCGANPKVVAEHVDVDPGISADGQPAEASVTRWTDCKPGGAAELWTIPGGGHGPDLSDAFPVAVLNFLEAHPKP